MFRDEGRYLKWYRVGKIIGDCIVILMFGLLLSAVLHTEWHVGPILCLVFVMMRRIT